MNIHVFVFWICNYVILEKYIIFCLEHTDNPLADFVMRYTMILIILQ